MSFSSLVCLFRRVAARATRIVSGVIFAGHRIIRKHRLSADDQAAGGDSFGFTPTIVPASEQLSKHLPLHLLATHYSLLAIATHHSPFAINLYNPKKRF
jgi:hypothetical protein